jgi:hypothetical protein
VSGEKARIAQNEDNIHRCCCLCGSYLPAFAFMPTLRCSAYAPPALRRQRRRRRQEGEGEAAASRRAYAWLCSSFEAIIMRADNQIDMAWTYDLLNILL